MEMEKKVEEMTLLEATDLLQALLESGSARTEEEYVKRAALYEHILGFCEPKAGGEG